MRTQTYLRERQELVDVNLAYRNDRIELNDKEIIVSDWLHELTEYVSCGALSFKSGGKLIPLTFALLRSATAQMASFHQVKTSSMSST